MAKFVVVETCSGGIIEEELINIDDISRIVLGANSLILKTPYGFYNGHYEYSRSITKKSVDKLLEVLNIIER